MAYFPFYIDIEKKDILVVGGGAVALRKVEKLLPFNPVITVVSPEICNEIVKLGVKTVKRVFVDSDLDGMFCVISATNNSQVNEHIYRLCSAKNIPVNTVDDKERCTFIFPALVKENGITAGITTSGKSPVYAKYVKEQLIQLLENINADTVEVLWKYRAAIKASINNEEERKEIFTRLLNMCVEGALVDDKAVEEIIKEYTL